MSNLDRRPRGRFRGPRGGRGKMNSERFESTRAEDTVQGEEEGEAGGYRRPFTKNTAENQHEHNPEGSRYNNRRGRFRGNRRRGDFRHYDQGGQRHYEEGKNDENNQREARNQYEEKKPDHRNEGRQPRESDDTYQQRSYRGGNRNEPYQERSQRGGQRNEHREPYQERSYRGGQRNERREPYQERSYRGGQRNDPYQERIQRGGERNEHHESYTERSYRGGERSEPYTERSHQGGERNEHYEPYQQRRYRGGRSRRFNRGRPYTSPDRLKAKDTVEETPAAPKEQERSSSARPRGDYQNNQRRGRYNNRRRGYRGGRFNRDSRQPEVHEEKPQQKVETSHPQPHYKPKHEPEAKKAAPSFTSINSLEPELRGFNVKCKAIGDPYKIQFSFRGKSISAWEVIVGDESGCIKLQLPNEEIAKAIRLNTSIYARNGIIIMRDQKFMVLLVNHWGKVEVSTADFEFQPNKSNNISDVEYEIAT
ncbi:unnamed protein product [Blepharisma stoltei]|uniref:Single-stranded DNA binding protein Ssb-like OB fold domain-containing protein n=1 Tax=Blepharisma stoltei TaxID=1481888 RepID=A0AAU9JB91_9CILI|nr:unnamed protein product [Blepharisma stoltei]